MALRGLRVIEMAGLAPAPFAGMMLADFGANVVRIDKAKDRFSMDRLSRGKRSVAVDLKRPEGVAVVRTLCKTADVVIEPFRPGVMEKMGLGPEVLCVDNPRLVYARLTGYGQSGPYAKLAGHDINYIAAAGVLSLFGRQGERPIPPGNVVADFAGGSMMCVAGIAFALVERSISGKGQVIDAAMVDGANYLTHFVHRARDMGIWSGEKGTNLLDTGAPFYDTYETKDGKYVSVGALEPQFYSLFIRGLGLSEAEARDAPGQMDKDGWPALRTLFTRKFKERTLADWTKVYEGSDACVMPVVDHATAATDPHMRARRLVVDNPDGGVDAAPAPVLSRTPAADIAAEGRMALPQIGEHTAQVLKEALYSEEAIRGMFQSGIVSGNAPQSRL